MYIKIDGQEWKLDFRYATEELYGDGNRQEMYRVTHCYLVSKDIQYATVSVCRPPDNFCKADGRKRTLTSMLKRAFPRDIPENKSKRGQVWEQYWATVKK